MTEPRTQTRFEFVEGGRNANGDDFIVECRCPEGGGPWVLEHVHPWNSGGDDLVYRQVARFGAPNAEAVDDVFGTFATLFGLAREGKVNKKGLPKNPLRFAATLRTLVKHEGFDAAVPIPVQRALAATLGRFAEARGYRSSYQQYLG